MGYIPGDHPAFADPVIARGRGVNTDEASAAVGSLRRYLTRGAYATLAAETPPAEPGAPLGSPGVVRQNPDEETASSSGGATVQARELFPLAFLVTGMWGPDPSHNLRAVDAPAGGGGRRSLPVVRGNPYEPRMRETFFERMNGLAAHLASLRERAEQRYDRSGAARGGRSRPWVDALGKMLRAVQYVREQGALAPARRSILGADGTPFGMGKKAWGVLAAQGNKKLPFVAYSELPMATCPGAGACGVRFDVYETGAKKGWCYSFKAWRYPDGFARQFLNTLANYADREFAILAAGGPEDPRRYDERVRAAVLGMDATPRGRLWPQIVKAMALALTKKARRSGGVTFLRLFVDGDVGTEDNIFAWMNAVAQMAPGSPDLGGTPGHVEVYGYSKCWQQFVNVDAWIEGGWPPNYTVNLSSGSVYVAAKYAAVRTAMERLPIARGYFEAVPLGGYLKQLEAQTALLAKDPRAPIPMPPEGTQHFRFDEKRIRAFVRLNAVRTTADLLALLPEAPVPRNARGEPRPLREDQVRRIAYDAYLRSLVADPSFGARVRRELARDAAPQTETALLDALEREQRARLAAVLERGGDGGSGEPYGAKALRDKALALVLHETLWSFGLGGSCPLVCGNCSDNPVDGQTGVHRCASKTTFRGKTIHIGIH